MKFFILALSIMPFSQMAFASVDCSTMTYDQLETAHHAVESTRALIEKENPTDQATWNVIGYLYGKQTEITNCQIEILNASKP